jgi:Polysaccharide lyase
MPKIKAILFSLSILLGSCSQPRECDKCFTENFNSFPVNPNIKNYNHSNQTLLGQYDITEIAGQTGFSSSIMPSNNYPVPHRAEFTTQLEEYYNDNDEIWIGFDFLAPSSYELDASNEGYSVVMFQVHSKPTEDSSWPEYNKNLPFNRPSIALHLIREGENFKLLLRYGLNGKKGTEFEGRKWVKAYEAPIQPDTWNTVVFNFKLSLEDEDGYIATWINEDGYKNESFEQKKVYGANMHIEAKPYLKMGLYRYWTDSHAHSFFYDNLTIAASQKDFVHLYNTREN